jgi:predicted GIY-YIG superfamily endonuclease
MHWIYILKCSDEDWEDDNEEIIYYIGQTKRLYSRFWEHNDGNGGINTSTWIPQEIVAIYKASDISKFITYNEKIININNDNTLEWTYNYGWYNPKYMLNNWDDIEFDNDFDNDNFYHSENNIAECLMVHNKDNWKNIRGGKYIRFDCDYKFPNNDYIKGLPLCNCGLPCDVKKNINKNRLYFRCAKKNMWDDLKENFKDLVCSEEEPCKFYREYLTDIELRTRKKSISEDRKTELKELFKTSFWLKNIHDDSSDPYGKCIGNCGKTNSEYKYIKWDGLWRTLCYDCFIDKNDELKQKYEKRGKCLISL